MSNSLKIEIELNLKGFTCLYVRNLRLNTVECKSPVVIPSGQWWNCMFPCFWIEDLSLSANIQDKEEKCKSKSSWWSYSGVV